MRVIPKSDWEKRMNEVTINKEDINKLIMDYFVVEGYKDAAESFATEAKTPC